MKTLPNRNISVLLFYCTVLFNSGLTLAAEPTSDNNQAGSIKVENSPKISPIPPNEWTDEILDALGAFPSSRDFVLGKWEEQSDDKRGQNVLGFLAHYPELAKAFLTLNKHVAADTSLDFRDKEIVILRTARLRGADNEFAQHIILGRRVGLTDEELLRFIRAERADAWPDEDTALVRAADELYTESRISAATMSQLAARFGKHQIMDIIFLAGCYSILSSAVNSFNIPLDSGMENSDPLIPVFLKARENEQ